MACAASQAAEVGGEAEFAALQVGFAGRYKVGLWTPLEVTLRGGAKAVTGRVRAVLSDSDGLNCRFEAAETCRVPPGKEIKVPLYVRFGRESGPLTLELLDGEAQVASKTFDSAYNPAAGQFPDALRAGQRMIVLVGQSPGSTETAVPDSRGSTARNVVAAIDRVARLPLRRQGYEGVDIVVLSTSQRDVLEGIGPHDARIEALDQWVKMGGRLVLSAGVRAGEVLQAKSPLARFVPGRYEKTLVLRQTAGWETLAKSLNAIPPPQPGEAVSLPTAKLVEVQGRVEAREADVPLVIRQAHGLGQVIFVATDFDRGSMLAWSDRSLLMAAILDLPFNEPPGQAADIVQSYGFNDLAGQLHSALEQFRGVRLVPFFVVALLAAVYILLIGPGDYFLLRRLGRGMSWTWITFPAVVVLFVAGAYGASSWLKGDRLRVNQVDLIDVDADGTARGASWFSIFSPRAQTFDLTMRPLLPNGDAPQRVGGSLAWFGKAGDEFNGMYSRVIENAAPRASRGYSIAPSMEAIEGVPIQVWSSKSFVYRWLGRAAGQGMDISLHEEEKELVGTITNRLQRDGGKGTTGVALSHAYLAYDGWAYLLGTLRPGESIDVGSATRRVSLSTFLSSESIEDVGGQSAQADKTPYDQASRDAAYVLRAMLFYDAADGRKRTGMADDYQRFADLSGLLKTGRAVLVAMPPQESSYRGGNLLSGPQPDHAGGANSRLPLSGPLDRHTIVYRFIAPVAAAHSSAP